MISVSGNKFMYGVSSWSGDGGCPIFFNEEGQVLGFHVGMKGDYTLYAFLFTSLWATGIPIDPEHSHASSMLFAQG